MSSFNFLIIIISMAIVVIAKLPTYSFKDHTVNLKPNGDFHEFDFGAHGKKSPTTFKAHLSKEATLYVFDCYCVGDSFKVLDNGHEIGSVKGKYDGDNNCQVVEIEPKKCLSNKAFAHGRFTLKKGEHKIEIKVDQSPYRAGSAFVMLE